MKDKHYNVRTAHLPTTFFQFGKLKSPANRICNIRPVGHKNKEGSTVPSSRTLFRTEKNRARGFQQSSLELLA